MVKRLLGVVVALVLVLLATSWPGTAYAEETTAVTVTVRAAGGPVASAYVDVYRRADDGSFSWPQTHQVRDGSKTLLLAPGTYRFRAAASVGPEGETALLEEFYDDASRLDDATDVVVSDSGAALTVPFVLDPLPTISGHVVTADGSGVPGAWVQAFPADKDPELVRAEVVTRADAEGRYALSVPSGRWSVRVTPNEPTDLLHLWWGGATRYAQAAAIEVDRADVPVSDVVLPRGARLAGRVAWLRSPAPGTTDVTLVDDRGQLVDTQPVHSGWDRFAFTDLRAGTYRLYAESHGFADTYLGGSTFETATPLVLAAGEELEGLELDQSPSEPGVPSGIDITGVVRDSDGNPVAGAAVGAFQSHDDQPEDSALTDASGRYYLTDLPRSTAWRLQLTGSSPWEAPSARATWVGGSTFAEATRIELRATGAVDVGVVTATFHAGIRGRITAAEGALGSGHVTLLSADGATVDRLAIGADGSYEFDRLEPDTSYRLHVDAAGRDASGELVHFAPTTREVEPTLVERRYSEVDVAVAPGPLTDPSPDGTFRVLGRLTAAGVPIRSDYVSVVAYPAGPQGGYDSEAPTYAPADADGVFALRLAPGVYRLRTWVPHPYLEEWYDDALTPSASTTVAVTDDNVILRPIDVAPLPSITGRVTDESGAPVAGVTVGIFRQHGSEGAEDYVATRADGSFSARARPGTWQVAFSEPRGRLVPEWYDDASRRQQSTPVEVGRGDVDLGTISMRSAGEVAGRVGLADGADAEVRVTLLDRDGDEVTWMWATEGFAFDGLAPGRYFVHFSTEPAFGREDYLREFFPRSHTWQGARAVEVVAGRRTSGIDATLEPRPAPDRTTVEMTGTVTDPDGLPAPGVAVTATGWSTGPMSLHHSRTAYTDAHGRYRFTDLDPTVDGTRSYEVRFSADGGPEESDDDDFGWAQQWAPGVHVRDESRPVLLPASGPAVADASLRGAGSLRVTAWRSPRYPSGDVRMTVLSPGGDEVVSTEIHGLAESAVLHVTGLGPGSYFLRFTGSSFPTRWWPGVPTRAQAKPITVASGTVRRESITMGAFEPPALVRPPAIRGTMLVGARLQADPGTWTHDLPFTFTYRWLRGGRVVGTGATYTVTPADAGAMLALEVRAGDGYRSSDVTTDPVRIPSLTRSTVGARAELDRHPRTRVVRRVLVSVSVDSSTGPAPGIVAVSDGGRSVGRATLRDGRAVIVLKRPRTGIHRIVVRYLGSGPFAAASATLTVRIKKPR